MKIFFFAASSTLTRDERREMEEYVNASPLSMETVARRREKTDLENMVDEWLWGPMVCGLWLAGRRLLFSLDFHLDLYVRAGHNMNLVEGIFPSPPHLSLCLPQTLRCLAYSLFIHDHEHEANYI